MYGGPSNFNNRGSRRRPRRRQNPQRPSQAQFPAAPHLNPNVPNSNLPEQNLGFQFSQPPSPGFRFRQPSRTGFQPQSSTTKSAEGIARINHAVAKAHSDLLVGGESISAWKVSQSALSILQVDSWEYLGFRMQEVDALHRLIVMEGKINSFIHCFVGVRRITTLYELEKAICKDERVKQFEELRLGPFLRHPLVLHYFSVNSEVNEVFKIKSEEIICYLLEFMDVDACRNKNIMVEDFLDFISRKRSVTKKEMLGIRVQNLETHISVIRKARRSEDDILSKYLTKSNEKRRKRPLFSMKKQQLDKRFSAVSQRVESSSSVPKDYCGKHVRFSSESSGDEDSDDNTHKTEKNGNHSSSDLKVPLQINKSYDSSSSCPYPSATEEVARLGLNGEVSVHASPIGSQKDSVGNGTSKRKRKRKSGHQMHTTFGSPTLGKKVKVEASLLEKDSFDNSDEGSGDEAECKITNNSLRMFITTWKDGCRDATVPEVLKRMFHHYGIKLGSRISVRSMISSYPFIGLLNVAVSSIKNGMWDSIYDSLQTINLHELTNTHVEKQPVYECIDVGPSAEGALIKHVPKSTYGITVEDILNKVGQHIKSEREIHRNGQVLLENRIHTLKQLCSCEFWLVEQFSVKDFKSLGHGDFFTFLQKHSSMLPDELRKLLLPEISEKFPLEACMLQRQLVNLVAQACNNLSENEIISKQMICTLLTQQFPSISFKLTENGSSEDFMELVGQQKNRVVSKCVMFSASLLGRCHLRDSLATMENDLLGATSVSAEVGQGLRAIESVTSEDAIKVLIRAPMLLDLNLWSHWDILFAPALGPLVPWLQNEVNIENFLCMVTKEGKVIRIDHTATADSFMEAALQGSPFQTAAKLLSIFALIGGEKYVPLSLLKHHASRAFDVIIKIAVENTEMFGNWAQRHEKVLEQVSAGNLSVELKKKIDMRNKAIPLLSRFFVDCLAYLPAEFRCLAANILLSAISSVIKDAASAILHECWKPEQRLMLHEIGLSLGVLEWIQDYHTISSSASSDLFTDACLNDRFEINRNLHIGGLLTNHSVSEQNVSFSIEENMCNEKMSVPSTDCSTKIFNDVNALSCMSLASEPDGNKDADQIIQSIRRDEFGLDPDLPNSQTGILRKQHARLGRALHCLSQELYSQDSHFLLELVQNADDNIYPSSVEPTLAFIFEESGIVVLNNEEGFSAKNIRALCDVGSSTKKGSNAGYIGKKGIGFKSVFRITDAPEIHSNRFHVKFDISEGQIGFVLPTIISPRSVNLYSRLVCSASDQQDTNIWNTCIVLPFKSKLSGGGNLINNIVNMFADFHPSLLLFLHRLQCIKIRNLIENSLIVMRKEIVGNGIIKVSHGEEKMTWLVVSQKLKADVIRHDVQSTEISIAFTLKEEGDGIYSPFLDQQPVFAFLPLRKYGLKFIIQGDFVLPSSREEVDGDSHWNQWLLSEFPGLFLSAAKSFCSLPCFESCPGKAIAAYMSYIPLIGEVHGFFSNLPRLIISKLRMSNCLLLEGKPSEWVAPYKVLRGWNEQDRILLPDNLLHEHLGIGFLDKDIILSDSLARALGIEEYRPKILVQFISSLCQNHNSLKSMGLVWLGSFLNVLHNMLLQSSRQTTLELERNADLVRSLQKVPLIPLSDGTYSSIAEGTIWLHSDSSNTTVDGKYGLEAFPNLNAKIRIVCPAFLSLFSVDDSQMDAPSVGNISRMLHRIGVQRLSAHEIIKVHVIPVISDESNLNSNKNLMTEYVCFIMTHLLSSCPECHTDREFIILELRNKALILTNHGYKRPVEVPIHFSKEYGNPIDIDKLMNMEMNFHEVDDTYLKHPVTQSLSGGLTKWRSFFQEIGITDFVHVVEVNRSIANMPRNVMMNRMLDPELISSGSVVKDWESPEFTHLLTLLSTHGNQESCKYLLEVLDTLWDDHLSDKVVGHFISKSGDSIKQFQSAFMNSICDVQWVVSSTDDKRHYPKDLFFDCDAVRSILGIFAPYAVPKVRSSKLVRDIGFKTRVSLDDTFDILKVWRTQKPFKTSISQMCTFYTFLWNEMAASKQKILEELHAGPFIFVPIVADSRHEDVVSGIFLSPKEVYWHDPIGAIDKIKDVYLQGCLTNTVDCPIIKSLCNIYPRLKNFFVDECGIHEYPPLRSYLQILKQLSAVALPSQAGDIVCQVFLKWANGLKSGLLGSEDTAYLKECIGNSEFMILPTEQDKWVSLHPSTGIVCWCDDKELKQQCKNMGKIYFVDFGEIDSDKTEVFRAQFSHLLKALGVPLLSEIVTREAKYYGPKDSSFMTSLMNWALPFAQRYVYSVHPDRYAELKQSEFDILSRLQVIVVEKLFFRNVIKNFGRASDEQIPCSCLLQDNILYTTQDSGSHSLFMEFSRLLFDGAPGLHLANFLHMITAMAESGSSEEQTECFILNTQKVTKLPKEEPVWSVSSVTSVVESHNLLQTLPNSQGSSSKAKDKARNWPPVDWKTAPGSSYARENGFKTQPGSSLPRNRYAENAFEVVDKQTENLSPVSTATDWTYEDDLSAMSVASVAKGSGDNVGSQSDSRGFAWKMQLRTRTIDPAQATVTGRLGEHVAFKYFTEKFSDTVVKWVNEDSESGFPFDIIVGDNEENRQYIEVKSTRSARKDWFDISMREWQFAVEKGKSFSIAHVLLLANNVARVSIFTNPVKQCQSSKLQLALLMPKQKEYSTVFSS
ncbi:uncharacterized protein LOC111431955 isoform X2 [Cucurbita moschata]|uniref:Uncharacterized protein LOC111431955 isoform X2 n=1 Tax=Cucurbita moschata TaxID=3662 RepID=A0A6J1EF31_CUCMO|nr:uncharacterized protein LOC111431955 isoform X2 [Cucurbita moschata]